MPAGVSELCLTGLAELKTWVTVHRQVSLRVGGMTVGMRDSSRSPVAALWPGPRLLWG